MFTETSNARLAKLHPALAARVRALDEAVPSLSIQVVQGFRTWSEQDTLYTQGRTAPGVIVTNAKGGQSAHNFGYAADLVPEDILPGQPDWDIQHPAWQKMLAAGPGCGLAEGAKWEHFQDNPHFYLRELPANPTGAMRVLLQSVGIKALWDSWAEILNK